MNIYQRKDQEKAIADDSADAGAWERFYTNQGRLWGGVPVVPEDLPAGSRILELGCGNGKLLRYLSGKTYDCFALDFSKEACHLAREAVNDHSVTIIIADARMIPLRSRSVDAIIACHIVGHLMAQERTALFREAARVLRHKGRLIFCDFSEKDFRAGRGKEVERRTYLRGNGIVTHYFTEEEVRSLPGPFLVRDLTVINRPMVVRGIQYDRAELHASFERI